MCIDICPVGALTSGAYRYKARPWEIQYVSTICAHCGDGCKTTLSVRNNQILRGNNRDHSGINGEFLCIKGRYAYDFIEHPERLHRPLIRKDEQLVETTWDEAIRVVASRWKQILARLESPETASPDAFGIIGSNHTTNEENYLLQKFGRAILKTNHVDHHRTADFPALMAALSADAVKRTNGTGTLPLARSRDLKEASAILLIGNNPTDQHPLLAWNIREARRLRGARLYVMDSRQIPLVRQSHRFLPVLAGREEDALRYLCGETEAEPKLLGRSPGGRNITAELFSDFRQCLQAEKDVVVVFGAGVAGTAVSWLVRLGNQLAGETRYIALGDYSNSRGASDMGLLPHLLPGYLPVEDPAARARFEQRWNPSLPERPGWPLEEMLTAAQQGRIEALYVVGANPLNGKDPGELRGKTFLVVQDLFLHETAQAADVVLPAASAYEKAGTVTNTCGELQKLRKAMEVLGAWTDLEILCRLAAALGVSLEPARPEEILEEIRQLVPGYGVSLVHVLAGGAEPVAPQECGQLPPAPTKGKVYSAQDTLFTSGTLGRYSNILTIVPERHHRIHLDPS